DSRVNLAKYDAYFVDSSAEKTIYLTFDLGYEMGYTPKILDTLKANDVRATFFVVKSYIDTYPSYIKRMVNEGHTVGNHTKTHPSLPDVTSNRKTFYNELLSVAESYKSVTGQDMPKLMRPPMGEYSELSLYLTKLLGYKTIFWSFGYYDWNPEEQPDKVYAFNKITSGTHDGAIMLLHGVSKTNTEILDDLIKNIKEQGYSLAPLD
ncbi:MAG: polysaccharide deacetylase family protein, partial [Eubacteriales bacterium]|nr:polysaccharide deacetylase family protein [Eubacteriales bacterium]